MMRVVDPEDPQVIAVEEAAEWARTVDVKLSEVEFKRRFVDCPDRPPEDGKPQAHEWVSFKVDDSKPCVFCGRSGRQNFAEATRARGELFKRVGLPATKKREKQ